MTEGLDTHVAGDENSCRTLAAALSGVADSARSGAAAFVKARNASEWEWASGDEFRGSVTAMAKTTDGVEDQCRRFAQALSGFADALASIKARMASTRAKALTGMLTVSGETIDFPTLGGASAMVAIDQIKLIAFGESLEEVAAARVDEANAHHVLGSALSGVVEQLSGSSRDPSLQLPGWQDGAVAKAVESSHKWADGAKSSAKSAAGVSTFTWAPDAPTTAAAATVGLVADSTGKGLELAAEDAAKELGRTSSGAAGVAGKSLGPVGALLGAVPAYVGDVNGGMSKPEAAVSEFGGAAMGTGLGMAGSGLAEAIIAGTTLGSVVPGAGTVVGLVVGAAVGALGSWGTSKWIQKVW